MIHFRTTVLFLGLLVSGILPTLHAADKASWQNIPVPPMGNIQAGAFFNDRIGIALGKGIFRTRDAGQSWEKVHDVGLRQLAVLNDTTAYAAGGGWGGSGRGLVYKTTDAGVTWQQIFDGPRGLFAVALLDESIIIVGSPWDNRTLWRSADAGKTWQAIRGASADAGMLLPLSAKKVLAIDFRGKTYRSDDAGLSWKKIAQLKKRARRGRMVLMPEGNIYFANSLDHALQLSTNDGATWIPVVNAPQNAVAINALPDGKIAMATLEGVWESDHAIGRWQQVFSTTNSINAVTVNGDHAWVWGGIWGGYNFGAPSMLLHRQSTSKGASFTGVTTLKFDMPDDGFATLVIDKLDGTRLRNLVSNVPVQAGLASFNWDGRDEWGNVVAAGTYQWRGLMHQGIHTDYQFHFNNPAKTPWDTADNTGGWGADHSNPQSIAFGKNQIYIAWPFAESGTRIIAIDPATGQRQWGEKRRLTLGNHYGGQAIALAADDQYLYVAMQTHEKGIGLYRLHADTGKLAAFKRMENDKQISEKDHVCQPRPAVIKPEYFEKLTKNQAWDSSNAAGSLRGCAVDKQSVYVASYHGNMIYVCDKVTAENQKTISVNHVSGIVAIAEGQLLAISGTGVLHIDVLTGKQTMVLEQGKLIAPMDITAAKDGSFYVTQRGHAMNVLHLNRHGKRIAAIGKEGGRLAQGMYDSTGMLMPRGLVVDAKNKLWVVEEDFAPRRISVWDQQRKLEREYVGCSTYGATGGAVNADNPDMALDTGTIFTLNWKTQKSTPTYSLPRVGSATGALFGWPAVGSASKPHAKARFIRYKNRQFLVRQDPPLMLFEQIKDKWLPRAAWGTLYSSIRKVWSDPNGIKLDVSMVPGIDLSQWDFSGHGKPKRGFNDRTYIWVDQNGDGLCQSQEFQSQEKPRGVWAAQHVDVDHHLNALLGDYKMNRQGWSSCGAPMYSFENVKKFAQVPADYPNTFNINYQTPQGWLIADGYTKAWRGSVNPTVPGLFCGYDPTGKRRWFYPSWFHTHGSHKAPPPQPGQLAGSWYFGGDVVIKGVGEVVHVMDNLGAHNLMTNDGLYLTKLFIDGRQGGITPDRAISGMNVDHVSNQSEGWASGFFRHAKDHEIYVISCLAKANAPCISKVRGLENVRRIAGNRITLDDTQIAHAREIPAQTFAGMPPRPMLVTQIQTPPVIDGKLDDWNLSQGVGLPVDDHRGAVVHMAWDENNIYLAYAVRDPNPLLNNGEDPKLMFKTGSALELKLAVNGKMSPRRKPIAGDLRMLMTVMQDKPVAVLYRPVATQTIHQTSFSSPNQRVQFDSVQILTDVKMAFTRQDKSYCFEACVPLSTFGLTVEKIKALKTRGDVGVIYGDNAGSINILRTCWASRNTNLVSDVAAEAALDPSEWGVLKFKP